MSTDSATTGADVPDAVAELRDAAEGLDAAEERVAEFGEAELEALADAHDEFTNILSRYEEPATGDGDFQKFIEFQSQIADFVDRLPDDLLLRETFEECDDRLQQRRLRERDFEEVRSNLEPVSDLAGRLDERRAAQSDYRSARNGVRHRLQTVRERIEDLERIQRLGDADLDAPTDELRDPIETYNATVRETFQEFRREAPAREVLGLAEAAQRFPVIEFGAPPADLLEYVRDREVGTEPIPRLLEYAEYSRSKLDHYVADPGALKTAVRPNTTYLRRLDAEPLTVEWPPPSAERLQYQCREAERVVNRFAPKAVEPLRAVKRLPKTADYERLRESAVARAELGDEQRDRLKSGAVADELAALQTEREALEEALAEFSER